MAISAVLRRAATSTGRMIAAAFHYRHSSSAAVLRCRTSIGSRNDFFVAHQRFCFSSLAEKKVSDAGLLKIIESEITCAEESDDHDRVEEIPEGFPFEIQDEKGKSIITLKRKYQDEQIEVTVSMPSLVTGDEPDNDERSSQSSIPLSVNVTKGSGPSLEFECTAYPDEVRIDSMSVIEASELEGEVLAYEGPDFNDLDENLQKAFHKYLELRGVTAMTTNLLHEYMINKDGREYLRWLKNLREFVEK